MFKTGAAVSIEIDYKVKEPVEDAVVALEVRNMEGVKCYATDTKKDRIPRINLEKDGKICLDIKSLELLPGNYTMDLSIQTTDGFPVDNLKDGFTFEMYSEIGDKGISRIEHVWKVEQ